MPDRRGQRCTIDELLPADRVTWAREVCADRNVVAEMNSGACMLRASADVLAMDQEVVDKLLSGCR